MGTYVRIPEHPVTVGERTEAIVLAELVKLGHRTLIPFGTNQRYDLVVDLGSHFVRIQCKTGRLRAGCVIFNAQSTRSNTRRIERRDYHGQIDMFAVYCPDTGLVYAVPVGEATRTVGVLRIDPPANGQVKHIRWAHDYVLADRLPPA